MLRHQLRESPAGARHRSFRHRALGTKAPAFWQVDGHYRYWKLHIVDEMAATLAVLDTEKPDVIVNFAAQGEGAASFGDNCGDWYRTNVLGLVRLTSALAKRQYLKRFIQIGSSEVYGGNQQNAKESDPLRPTSPYGVSKAAFDMHLDIIHRVHGFPANVVRPVNCYVRGQQLHRIIPKATLCAVGGKKLPLQGGGKSEKSYLHSTGSLARADGDHREGAGGRGLQRRAVSADRNTRPRGRGSEGVRCAIRGSRRRGAGAHRSGQPLLARQLEAARAWLGAVSLPRDGP
jgi:nucleoside-diphosphate-sugar epimerase